MRANRLTPSLVALVLTFAATAHSAAASAADTEPIGMSLLAADTLTGWDHGAKSARGWRIENGKLSGTAESTPLLAGWTCGDFELRFQWSARNGGRWRLSLPDVAGDNALVIEVHEGDGSGRILSGANALTAGIRVPPRDDAAHTAVVHRTGDRLTVSIDDQSAGQCEISEHARFGMGLALAAGEGALWDLRMAEPPGEPIFNGRDLAGWWTPGNLDSWIVENGELVCINRRGNYLRSEKLYGNCTLSLEYKMQRRGNSGIGIRTARNGWPSGDGIELQLLDRPNTQRPNRSSTMAIYGNLEPIALADKSEAWNHVVIKTDGYMITAWVNGVLAQHANTAQLPELQHRHLQGWIGFQDHGARIQFRDIRVLEAPEGLGLKQWYTGRAEPASQQVLDRLMNPERLTRPGPIRSGVASTQVTGSQQQVLAELTGPGALVRCWWPGEEGRLSFYFDGESRPRLQCDVGQLHQLVPPATVDQRPVLTHLAYESSLKIVLEEGTPGTYRFDYVSLEQETPVQTFADRETSIARGMLPAMSYRSFQISHGTHREADPLPRQQSDPQDLQPGSAARLISLDGAGVVRWWKLRVAPQMLTSDDLWIEVHVDGQQSPAVAAPARYLFPGLQGGGNFHNFVMLDRGGPTCLLVMPYTDGLSITAHNRGSQVMHDVAAAVSFQPADGVGHDSAESRLQLRGVFLPANASASSEIFTLSGAGRWIGLVHAHSPDAPLGIETLTVDGREQDGWASQDLDALIGIPSGELDARRSLSGRRGGLAWRYLLLAPIDFQSNIRLAAPAGRAVGDRLALFYVRQ